MEKIFGIVAVSMRVTLVLVDPVFYKFTLIQFRSCSTVVQMTVKVTSVYAVCVPLFYLYEVSVLLFHHGVAAISDCICVCVFCRSSNVITRPALGLVATGHAAVPRKMSFPVIDRGAVENSEFSGR